MELPPALTEGVSSPSEKAARIGRFLVLQEMGFFGEETNLKLAKGGYKGNFIAGVRKNFSGMYGDVGGCSAGDIEVTMELLEVMDDILDYELEEKNVRAA